jgi:hypothetical protein
MCKRYKYDVAFSVAEEDVTVAQQIADALRSRGIKFYLYTDRHVDDWGKNLVDVTFRRYAKESKFTLLITSKTFVNKYWTGIENQVIQSYSLRKEDVLTLRIDDSSVDGLSQFKVFVRWENNPDEIAAKIEKKVKTWKKRIRVRVSFAFSISCLLAFFCYFFIEFPKETPGLDAIDHSNINKAGSLKIPRLITDPLPHIKNTKGSLLIEGNVRDELTNELLDDVLVSLEGVQARTKNGRYSIAIMETAARKRGTELSVNLDFSKAGYKNYNSVETFFWNKDMAVKNIPISLTKLK